MLTCGITSFCETLPAMHGFLRKCIPECSAMMVFAVLVGVMGEVSAQFGAPVDVTPPVGAPEWKAEVIQFEPRHGLRLQQHPEDQEPSRTWVRFLHLPPAGASDKEIIAHIQEQTAAAKRVLGDSGFTLPTGTAILWDDDTGTLAVRSTHEVVEWLKALGSESRRKVPCNIRSTLHVIQADGDFLRLIAQETIAQLDHTPAWKRLEKLIAEGKATEIQTLSLQSKSGVKGEVEVGSREDRVSAVMLDERGVLAAEKDEVLVGTGLEAEQILGPDGYHVYVNLAVRHHFSTSTRHEVRSDTALAKELTLPAADDHYAVAYAAVTVLGSSRTLIGLWKPSAPGDIARRDVLQAAFLETRVVRNLPEVNPRALTLLSAHMNRAEPIPTIADKPVAPPAGMKTIRLSVPPDFLALGGDFGSSGSPAASDPFAPAEPFPKVGDGPKKRPTYKTAIDVMKDQGIPFPAGAMALFDQESSTLTVTNTPENLELIENYFSSMLDGGRPENIQMNLEIVEADGALIRALAAESSSIADHTKLLERLDEAVSTGKARYVGVQRVVTRSGQRGSAESGTYRIYDASLESVTEAPQDAANSVSDANSAKASPETSINPEPQKKAAIKVSTVGRMVGTRVEFDGIISPDGVTVEMDLALEHHYAPPTRASSGMSDSVSDPSTVHVKKAVEVFHFAQLSSSFTMRSGTTRMVGTWKPEGASEYDGKDVMQMAFVRAAITRAE